MAEANPSTSVAERIVAWSEPAFKALVILGLVAVLWLNSNYVRSERYESDRASEEATRRASEKELTARMDAVERALLVMAEAQKDQARQDTQIADHEARIRALEAIGRSR